MGARIEKRGAEQKAASESVLVVGTPYRADWRDPSAYPPPGCDDLDRLAWEFLRRNSTYALHAQQMMSLPEGAYEGGLEQFKDASLDGQFCWPPAKSGETVGQYLKRRAKKTTRSKIYRPDRTFRNRWSLEVPVSPEQSFDSRIIRFRPFKVAPAPVAGLKGRNLRLPLLPNETAFRFRLDLNLNAQVKALQAALKQKMVDYEQSLNDDRPDWLVSLSSKHKKQDLQNAHFWLRCYDARAVVAGQRYPDHPTKRRAKINGPDEQIELFKEEVRIARRENSPDPVLAKIHFGENAAHDYVAAATDRIVRMGYLLLLDHFVAPSRSEMRRASRAESNNGYVAPTPIGIAEAAKGIKHMLSPPQ